MEAVAYQANYQGKRNDREVVRLLYDDPSAGSGQGLGRRLAKEVESGGVSSPDAGEGQGGGRTEYVYDGLDPAVEYRVWHGQRDEFYRGEGARLLAMRHFPDGTEGQSYWYHYDGRGNVAGLTKDEGQSTHDYRYDAYGRILPAKGNWTDPHDHYTFGGKEWEEHLSLYEFGYRLYDPQAGVWLTGDPLRGSVGRPRTLHRYQYAFASPISYYDAYGLQGEGPGPTPAPPAATLYPDSTPEPSATTAPVGYGTYGGEPTPAPVPEPPTPYQSSTPSPIGSLDKCVRERSWRRQVLLNLAQAGPACRRAVQYIVKHDVQIGFAEQNTGARWTLEGDIELNPDYYSLQTSPADPRMLGTIVHETKHLEQGFLLALSVEGEVGGWTAESNARDELGSPIQNRHWQAVADVGNSSLTLSNKDLRVARSEMVEYAGHGYLVWLLPLRGKYWQGWYGVWTWYGVPWDE